MTWFWFCAGLLWAMSAPAEVEFKLVTQQNVTEARAIDIFRAELYLGSETIERILLTDVLNDGFDENDALTLYPTGRVLRLQPISERLDSLLNSFRLPPNAEIYDRVRYHREYDSVAVMSRGGRALGYGLLAGLQEQLARGYRGNSLEGYFKVSGSGAQIRLWNFDSTRVSFPRRAPNAADTVYIYVRDTVYVPEIVTVKSDPIVIRDTLYLPSELLRRPRGVFYRAGLGMLGGGFSLAQREASRGRLTIAAGNEWDFGVWDRWISGRQEINSRIGLRFTADMAPWKSDTLSPRFLGTMAEVMYIPAWDRALFVFGGLRLFYHDDLFWDRARAGWDEELYVEPSAQDLAQYELTAKIGLDKLAPYGAGKKVGAWLKLSGFSAGSNKSGYDLLLDSTLVQGWIPAAADSLPWRWEHAGGTDVEVAGTLRLNNQTQFSISAGLLTLANLHYQFAVNSSGGTRGGLLRMQQFYQTASLRVTPLSSESYRLRLTGSFRNNGLVTNFKRGADEALIEEIFYPYFKAPQADGTVELDYSVLSVRLGVQGFLPEGEARVLPWGGLYFLFK